MSAPLSPEQRAAVRRALRYTPGTASPDLVQRVAETVDQARGAEPETTEWRAAVETLIERTGLVLRRLLEAESRAERYRIAWRMARTRAVSVGGAADRAGARVRELLPALQDAVFATIAMQMERDAALDEAARLRLAWKSARRGRATARTRTAVLEAERHSANEALDDAVAALRSKGQEPDPEVVAYRSPGSGSLYCLNCCTGVGVFAGLTSDDLPDGGLCAACDVDVLITPAEAGEPR